jgi:uncharacterized protein YecA (UPF0149 family)
MRCTKKMISELGLSGSALVQIRPADSLLGNWYANALRFGRHKAVIVVNEKTLYSFILPGGFKKDPRVFTQSFLAALASALRAKRLSQSAIDGLLAEYQNMEFTITESGSVLGSMNDIVSQYDYYIEAAGGLDAADLASLTYKVNETPQKNLSWSNSHDALNGLLSDAGLTAKLSTPVQKHRDEDISLGLRKIGSPRTIHEIYGLFYGCAAAPSMTMPSQYLPLVFDPEKAVFDSEEDARILMTGLMELWNQIAGWRPGMKTFYYPIRRYPDGKPGVLQRGRDIDSFVEYFIKGLDIGKTIEHDFPEDALDALKGLGEITAYWKQVEPMLEASKDEAGKEIEQTADMLDKIERVAVDCIARIHAGLKRDRPARPLRVTAPASRFPDAAGRIKIGRNEACPCGSGRKYKRCCGLTH